MDKIIEAMRAQGATDADIEAYLRQQGAVEVRPKPRGFRTPEQIARLNKVDAAVNELGPFETLAGGAAAAGQGLTLGWGDELAAAARRPFSNKSYPTLLDEVRKEQEVFKKEYPKANLALNIAGGSLLPVRSAGAGIVPAARTGAGVGALAGAGAAEDDPFARAIGLVGGGVTGGALGGLLGLGGTVVRYLRNAKKIYSAPSLGTTEKILRDARAARDKANYGVATVDIGEPMHPAMAKVLAEPDIAPVVERLKGMKQWAGVDDADPKFLDAVYKNAISDWKLQLDKAQVPADPSKPNTVRALKKHLDLLREQFLKAADLQMPGYRQAVEESASARGLERTFAESADAARRITERPSIAGRNIAAKSPEAFEAKIKDMTPEEAVVAEKALLGRGHEAIRFTSNPVGKFGLYSSLARAARSPVVLDKYLALLEEQMGRPRRPSGRAVDRLTRAATVGLFAR